MQARKTVLSLVLTVSVQLGCEEQNPYKDQFGAKTGTAAADGSAGSGNAATTEDDGSPTPSTGSGEMASTLPAEAAMPAKPDAIAQQTLSSAQLVCQHQESIQKFPVEMAVLCVNGQPTTAFANALSAPYKGTGTPQLGVVKSQDVNGVSHFVLMSAVEIPQPLATVFGRRQQLNAQNFTEGNATVTQTEVAPIAAAGGAHLGGFELRFNMRVTVGIINVTDIRVQNLEFSMVKDQQVIAAMNYLKAGAPDNADNTVANIVSFWIADGNTTKLVGVTHQQAANRGQHQTAETTALAIGRRTMVNAFQAFSQ